jgi:hypothetical protein
MKDLDPEEANTGASIKEHEVFKVVDSRRCSCLSLGCYSVHYQTGRFIRAPEGTKFFVFDSLEHAYDFKRLNRDLRVWKATARGLSAADRTVCDPKERVDIEDYWRVHNGGGSYGILEGRRTPFGTFWADEVRLDERVRSEELPQQHRGRWLRALEKFVNRLLGLNQSTQLGGRT